MGIFKAIPNPDDMIITGDMALAGMPALFASCGFVTGAVGAIFYYRVAKRWGGIVLDLEQYIGRIRAS